MPLNEPSLGPWPSVLARFDLVRLPAYPPRWTFRTGRGRVITCTLVTTVPDFGLAIETPLPSEWIGLTLMPRGLVLDARTGLETGDHAFDRAVFASHPSTQYRGLFGAETRALARTFVAHGGLIDDEHIRLTAATTCDFDRHEAQAALDALMRIADHLQTITPRDAHALVERIARSDPDPEVRGQYRQWAPEPEPARPVRTTDPDSLLATVRDRSLRLDARDAALTRLVETHPFARVAELEATVLWDLTLPDAVFIAALRRQSPDPASVRAALRLAQSLSGSAVTQPTLVVLALLDALGDGAADDEVIIWLDRLTGLHPDRQVQLRAAHRVITCSGTSPLLARIATPELVARWQLQPGMVMTIVERLVHLVADTQTSDDDVERVLAALAGFTPPTLMASELALRLARALEARMTPAARRVLLQLIAHPHEDVARRALQATFELTIEPTTILDALTSEAALLRFMSSAPKLARERGRDAAPLLRACYDRHRETMSSSRHGEYLETLSAIGDTSDTPCLVDALASDDPSLVLAAMQALTSIGDVRALVALKPLASGIFRDREVKTGARRAIAAIIDRGGDPAGALSVSDDHTGGLSVDEP